MSYYSKQKNELRGIGADAFALLDAFSSGRKSKPPSSSSSSAPTSHASKELMYHCQYQYQSNPNYMGRRQVYVAPVETMSTTETVVDCYEAAKKYGGTVIVDYPKKKPSARRGFFYR